MDGYHIATSVFESQYSVKKSRFIARVVPIESRACALTAVDSAKTRVSSQREFWPDRNIDTLGDL